MMKQILFVLMALLSMPLCAQVGSVTNLSKMTEESRNEYLKKAAKEVMMNCAPDWYREPMSVEISGANRFDPNITYREFINHPNVQKRKGCYYYKVTYWYDHYKSSPKRLFAFSVSFWENDGEPLGIAFGNDTGMTFVVQTYRSWIKSIQDGEHKVTKKYFDEDWYDYFAKLYSGEKDLDLNTDR